MPLRKWISKTVATRDNSTFKANSKNPDVIQLVIFKLPQLNFWQLYQGHSNFAMSLVKGDQRTLFVSRTIVHRDPRHHDHQKCVSPLIHKCWTIWLTGLFVWFEESYLNPPRSILTSYNWYFYPMTLDTIKGLWLGVAIIEVIGSASSFLGATFIIVCYLVLPTKRHFCHILILNLALAGNFF